jgi:hypothetical protein
MRRHGKGRVKHESIRASPAGRPIRPPRVRIRSRGQSTRSSGATQTDKAIQRRPRAPISVSDLGPKCVGPDSPRVLPRAPPCPPLAQPTEVQAIFPSPPYVALLLALLLLFIVGAATPTAGVHLLPQPPKKKPLLPPHPDAILGHRRPPIDGHGRVD